MTLEEVLEVMEEAQEKGLDTVRLHTGDPSLYGAVREQMQTGWRSGAFPMSPVRGSVPLARQRLP